MKWPGFFCFNIFLLLTVIEVYFSVNCRGEEIIQSHNNQHDVAKRLWRIYDGAEPNNLERRNLKEVAYDETNTDENVLQLQDIDEMSLGPEELQVDFDSPEYRKLALQQDELQGNVYEER